MKRKNKKTQIKIATADEAKQFGSSEGDTTDQPSTVRPVGARSTAHSGHDSVGPSPGQPANESTVSPPDELAELRDQLLRAKAEAQNIRKRSTNEMADAVRYANAALIKDLLAILDDFDRTLEQDESSDVETLLKGVRLIRENFYKTLTQRGVVPIDAMGQPFDPAKHDAMMQKPSLDRPSGTVLEVFQTGYTLADRVLRPAKVVVAQAQAQAPAPVAPQSKDATDGASVSSVGHAHKDR